MKDNEITRLVLGSADRLKHNETYVGSAITDKIAEKVLKGFAKGADRSELVFVLYQTKFFMEMDLIALTSDRIYFKSAEKDTPKIFNLWDIQEIVFNKGLLFSSIKVNGEAVLKPGGDLVKPLAALCEILTKGIELDRGSVSREDHALLRSADEIARSKSGAFRLFSNKNVDIENLAEDIRNYFLAEQAPGARVVRGKELVAITDEGSSLAVLFGSPNSLQVSFRIVLSPEEFETKSALGQAVKGKGSKFVNHVIWLGGKNSLEMAAKGIFSDMLLKSKSKSEQLAEISRRISSRESEVISRIEALVRERFVQPQSLSVAADDIPAKLMKLNDLRIQGILTEEEFAAAKVSLLGKL